METTSADLREAVADWHLAATATIAAARGRSQAERYAAGDREC